MSVMKEVQSEIRSMNETLVTLANELTGRDCTERVEPRGAQMVVTPKEIDLLVDRAAKAVSLAINSALQPHLKMSVIAELV